MESKPCRFCGSSSVIGECFQFDGFIWSSQLFSHPNSFDDRVMVPVVNENNFQKNPLYLIYTNYDKPVESFFLIGGLLACWSIMNALDK
jgi:hypothetical protein